ncbi:MAG: AAA family ATPase [Chloroflexi bacterium]|nr:AAA family ATPase [Chloroflexota bacterium]
MEFSETSVQREIVDDLDALLGTLPSQIAEPIVQRGDRHDLLEVVMDLGRLPEARFPNHEVILHRREVTEDDLAYVVARIGAFGGDNRAGIERTLHRISAFRNRKGRVVGLTCRVGRAVFGTIKIIEDLVRSGKSLLLLGRPGVGKTTMLREVARVLADDMGKRVVIVDTSNEIAGDGDIPHPAIGRARRMQVPTPSLQHAVMIEAVENHMPEVIVIDEIGTELEAAAARTIAERGVQLVATAHGNTLENVTMNPTLCDLVGGIQTVTLGDEEARRRGTQKSVLERKAPPTFDVVVEIQSWVRVAVHPDVAQVVDMILRGLPVVPQVRLLDERGRIGIEKEVLPPLGRQRGDREVKGEENGVTRLLTFGVNHSLLGGIISSRGFPVKAVELVEEADMVLTLRSYYRRKPQVIRDAEALGIPIYVLRNNTAGQIEQSLASIVEAHVPLDAVSLALKEAEEAIKKVASSGRAEELSPQRSYIRRLQHQMAEAYNLSSRSSGKEPYRRVKIFAGAL